MPGWRQILQRLDDHRWELPVTYKDGMRVPARIYASEALLDIVAQEHAIDQAANVACLPGIEWRSLAMPDIHWGYGFPIGGVAAMRLDDGVVSPGGVGFDINCGARVLTTTLSEADVRPHLQPLLNQLFRDIPAGIGGKSELAVSADDLDAIMVRGAAWMVERGYGRPEDLEATESRGCLPDADPAKVSARARQRGHVQLGSLGSGNHFLEIQVLERIFEPVAARAFGLTEPGQVLVFLHTGSRGFGHQVCQDFLELMERASHRYAISLPDRQLACAPLASPEGRDYLAAMACAANFAWANRQRNHPPRPPRLRPPPGPLGGGARPAGPLRRRPQHRQDRAPPPQRPRDRPLRPPQRRHPRLPPPATRTSPRATARWASPSSSPAT